MNIPIGNLTITSFCSNNIEHIKFAKEITEDESIRDFVSHNMDEWLEDSENTDKLYIGPAYIAVDRDSLIGFIRMASLSKDGILNLHYGVHPEYRNKKYGTKILLEISEYIFKTMPSVEKIQLFIEDINEASIKCARNTGFKHEDTVLLRKGITKIYVKTR